MCGEDLDKPVGHNGVQKQKLNEEEWASESDRIEFKSSYTILQGPDLKLINLSETQFPHQHSGDELLLMKDVIGSTWHLVGT